MRLTRRQFILLGAFCLCSGSPRIAHAQTDSASLPARESHDGLVISADPYHEEARYKDRFGKKNPYDAGIVAIEVFFRNDNDRPIRVGLEGIRLILKPEGHDRQRLLPLTPEDVTDQIVNPAGAKNPTAPRVPLPRPIPRSSRGKDWQKIDNALQAVALSGDLVPPHGTLHGFLYFDVDDHYDWVYSGTLYFPDLKLIPEQKPLFYFEVSLAPARPR